MSGTRAGPSRPAANGVLKKESVRPAGTQRMQPAPAQPAADSSPGTGTSGPPEAQIVDTGDGVVTIEVRCPCGRKTYLQCFYGQAGRTDADRPGA